MTVKFTKNTIEGLLAKESYAFVPRLDRKTLTDAEVMEVKVLESITSYGQDIISLFDNMIVSRGTLPSHQEYIDAGLAISIDWLKANRPEISITPTAILAIKDRVGRTYTSKVVELHLERLLKEDFPHLKVINFPLLDSVMGVDFVIEDDVKRYYVHVTTTSQFSETMLKQKEKRGGTMVGSTYVRYSRDFAGDMMLKYDRDETYSTHIVNGFPLFKAEYIEWRFNLVKKASKIGEDLGVSYSKLDHFKDWAKTYLKLNLEAS